MQPPDELAHLGQRQHGFLVRVGDRPQHRLWPFGETCPGHAEVHRQRDQPLLGPVVQVTLDPAALGVGRGDDLGPALGQRLEPEREFLALARSEQRPGQHLVGARHLLGEPGRGEQQRRGRPHTRAAPAAARLARRSGSRSRASGASQQAMTRAAAAPVTIDSSVKGDLPPRTRGQPGADRPWRARRRPAHPREAPRPPRPAAWIAATPSRPGRPRARGLVRRRHRTRKAPRGRRRLPGSVSARIAVPQSRAIKPSSTVPTIATNSAGTAFLVARQAGRDHSDADHGGHAAWRSDLPRS